MLGVRWDKAAGNSMGAVVLVYRTHFPHYTDTMKYRITKEFHFSAAHRLPLLPKDHKCHNLHGHNYIVLLVLETSMLDDIGFVVDFGGLGIVKAWIDEYMDHGTLVSNDDYNLRDFVAMEGDRFYEVGGETTAENLARHVYLMFQKHFPELVEVHVSETPKTWAIYRG